MNATILDKFEQPITLHLTGLQLYYIMAAINHTLATDSDGLTQRGQRLYRKTLAACKQVAP